MRFLPRWLRILIATWKVKSRRGGEWGGSLYDFAAAKNGDLELICKWENDEQLKQAQSIVNNAREVGRDFVYVGAVKTGHREGYMIVHSKLTHMWLRGFVPGIYEPWDAYRDAMNKAKEDADKLGFRFPFMEKTNESGA